MLLFALKWCLLDLLGDLVADIPPKNYTHTNICTWLIWRCWSQQWTHFWR